MSNSTAVNKAKLIEELRKTPIVQVAVQRAGIGSRTTYYRWLKTDKKFAEACTEAIEQGSAVINDLAEAQLISAIKDKNMTAVLYWLRMRHPAYAAKIKLDIKHESEELTPEQEAVVKKALRLANLLPDKEVKGEKS